MSIAGTKEILWNRIIRRRHSKSKTTKKFNKMRKLIIAILILLGITTILIFIFHWLSIAYGVTAFEIFKALAPIIQAIGGLLVGIVALTAMMKYGKVINSAEKDRSLALGDVSFRYEISTSIYLSNRKKILEQEIKMSNASNKKLGMLAIFVYHRPIIKSGDFTPMNFLNFDTLGEFSMDNEFEKRSTMTKAKNIGYLKESVWQTAVTGVMVRRSFEIMDEEFYKKYPIIMTKIVMHGASMDTIDKTHYPKLSIGPLREDWLKYTASKYLENYDFFSRNKKESYKIGSLEIQHGARILIHKNGDIDEENTVKFWPLLHSIVTSIIEKVVVIGD